MGNIIRRHRNRKVHEAIKDALPKIIELQAQIKQHRQRQIERINYQRREQIAQQLTKIVLEEILTEQLLKVRN